MLKEQDPEKIKGIKWRNHEYENLTAAEKRGLKKLKKHVEKDEVVIVKTDKSGKFGVISKEKYLEMGKKGNEIYKRKIENEQKMEVKRNENTNSYNKCSLEM